LSEPCLRWFVMTGTPSALPPLVGTVIVPVGLPLTFQLAPGFVSAAVYAPGIKSVHVSVRPFEPMVLQLPLGCDGPVMQSGNVWLASGVTPFQSTLLVTLSEPCLRVLLMTGTTSAEPPFAGTVIVALGLPLVVQLEPGSVSAAA